MHLNRSSALRLTAYALALAAAAFFLAACDDGSVDSSAGVPSDNNGTIYNYSGLYARPVTNGLGVLVFPPNSQSGTPLTWMRLIQYGSVLEGYDNAGLNWSGSISAQNGGAATFNLNGRTTAGNTVSIAGTLATATVSSGSTNGGSTAVSASTAVMDATWIEPSFAGSIFAQATISPPVAQPPLKISPTSASLNNEKETQQFAASGGSGSYTWSVTDASKGTVSPASGNLTTYTATKVSGNNTVTLTDSSGRSVTASVTYSGTSTNASAVSINPAAPVTIQGAIKTQAFSASGGSGQYSWTISSTVVGSLNAYTGASVTFTAKGTTNGTSTITVYDTSDPANKDDNTITYQLP